MGITERKERQKTELRKAIIAAARRIFEEEGAEALTMRRIADAIEYSPGTIYLYFANREEIALQLVYEGFAKLLTALEPALAVADPVARLHAIGDAYVAFGLTDPQTYKLIFMENAAYLAAAFASGGSAADDVGQRAFDVLARTVREAIAAGKLTTVDADGAAAALWAGLHGVISLHITCPTMMPEVAAVASLMTASLIAGMSA